MLFEKSSHDPLTDRESDRTHKEFYSSLVLFSDSENSFHEEFLEGIQRVLVHIFNEIELNH